MAKCLYCKRGAGFFRKYHKECKERYDGGWQEMLAVTSKAIRTGNNLDQTRGQLTKIALRSHVAETHIRTALARAWSRVLDEFLDDHVLTEAEESRLTQAQEAFGLSQSDLDTESRAFTKCAQAAILRGILNGERPEWLSIRGNLPFNFQRSETLIWVSQDVEYYQQVTRRHYEGGSAGVSMRIAKGVYVRSSRFRGYPVDTTELKHIDTGLLGLTTKHVYFGGDAKSFRVPFKKIVSITPYSDGFSIMRDAMTAKPQVFCTSDSWFLYNAATNLAKIAPE